MAQAGRIDNRRDPIYTLKLADSASNLTRRVKSEIGFQFLPEPINEPIFLD